jgi:hypothetical protein
LALLDEGNEPRIVAVEDRMAWAQNPLSDRHFGPLNDDLFVARGYRMKAEECRAVAEEMHDAQARASLLSVALYYERLAKRHEGPLSATDRVAVSRALSRA